MLGCDETVTLVRCVEAPDGDSYVCTVLNGVSWFAKISVAVNADGAKPVNTLKVRIPDGVLPGGVEPGNGNYMVRGALASLGRPEELSGLEYFTVTAVGDNRRGGLPHWAVSGA